MKSYAQFRKVWGAPIMLTAVTTFGLLAALLGTGIWHWLSWIAISVPIVVMAWCLRPRASRS